MQEKIDDILGEPLVETEENKKMIRTPHGELPNYSVGERFGIVNGVRKKVKVPLEKNIYFARPSQTLKDLTWQNLIHKIL